ncbi:DUF2621 domain-containing protein [Paenibacillus sp. 481]|uniref:DUF2621 domain-containing protein n=1 Tax=Paenibacillus sp. 481 TaxID=2835869 RepID=UPI001E4F3142|nr:DUF2621 domain-containing protein [Paenibacillus sp. 481]UHA72071.1 DUF2621 domain-containing protein [Paenibacillus sp. 481]
MLQSITIFPLATSQPATWFMNTIAFWTFIMIGSMAIGGYFMFRKFLKVLPKQDGKSKLDWQNYWVERSRPLWTDESKAFLNVLVEPVPNAFRDIAKHTIAARIGQVAIESGATEVTRDHCLQGYILATPKRDYRSLIRFLNKNNIDYSPYKHMLNK